MLVIAVDFPSEGLGAHANLGTVERKAEALLRVAGCQKMRMRDRAWPDIRYL